MRIAIYGYGNLGRGVERATKYNPDVELVGIFTRRPTSEVTPLFSTPVYKSSEIESFKDVIDVLLVCGGSASDLPTVTPILARHFSLVDSFDNHTKISRHLAAVDSAATASGHLAVVGAGWDPGLFSLVRLLGESALPRGSTHTFWGRGVSQGHSEAIRRIDGVLDARQYTVPIPEAIYAARCSPDTSLTPRQKHRRECYVLLENGADPASVERQIKNMPDYFADYDTSVTFITPDELVRDHLALPHGGFVIRTGRTDAKSRNTHRLEFSLKLDSNPEFTGSVLICVARAVDRMRKRGEIGCRTVLDIPPADYSPHSRDELVESLL